MTDSSHFIKFNSTDSIINTMVSQSCETTLRARISFKHHLDLSRLKSALDSVLKNVPILSCQLIMGDKPVWRRLDVTSEDVFFYTDSSVDFERFNEKPIDVVEGPLLRCGLLRDPHGDCLLVKISHEATDGDGFKQAVAQLAHHYNNPSDHVAASLPSNSDIRSPYQLLNAFSWWRYPLLLGQNIKQKFDLATPPSSINLSRETVKKQAKAEVTKAFSVDLTDRIKRYARSNNVTVNDVLLTACLRAMIRLGNWNEKDALRITMSINLRRYLPSANLLTVCNMSGMECLNLGLSPGVTFGDTLRKVTDITQQKKSNWVGLGAMFDFFLQDLLPYRWVRKLHAALFDNIVRNNNTPFLLTNIGAIRDDLFRFDCNPDDIEFYAPAVYAPFWNSVAYEYKGRIKLACSTYDGARRVPTLNAFYDEIERELADVLGIRNTMKAQVMEPA